MIHIHTSTLQDRELKACVSQAHLLFRRAIKRFRSGVFFVMTYSASGGQTNFFYKLGHTVFVLCYVPPNSALVPSVLAPFWASLDLLQRRETPVLQELQIVLDNFGKIVPFSSRIFAAFSTSNISRGRVYLCLQRHWPGKFHRVRMGISWELLGNTPFLCKSERKIQRWTLIDVGEKNQATRVIGPTIGAGDVVVVIFADRNSFMLVAKWVS